MTHFVAVWFSTDITGFAIELIQVSEYFVVHNIYESLALLGCSVSWIIYCL